MNKLDLLEKQLDYYYTWIIRDKNRSLTTRSWCLTLWIVNVVLIISNKIALHSLSLSILICLPVFLFWLLDGFHNTFIDLNEQKAMKIENLLLSNKNEPTDLQEYMLISGHINTPFFLKIQLFLTSLFLRETVSLFYFILFVVSLFLIRLESVN